MLNIDLADQPFREDSEHAYTYPNGSHFKTPEYISGLTDKKRRSGIKRITGLPNAIISQLKFDDEGFWSFAGKPIGIAIIKYLESESAGKTVVDAFAGVGGITSVLAGWADNVVAVEKNETRAEYLRHNMEVLDIKNVSVVCDDFLLMDISADAVIYDIPWGLSYRAKAKMTISIGDITLEELIALNREKFKHFIVRLPRNYDTAYFSEKVEPISDGLNWTAFKHPNSCILVTGRYL